MSGATKTFHADGMHCHGCEQAIETAVRKIAGVASVNASYPTETVTVEYDAATTGFPAIRDKVEQLGYRVFETRRAPRHPVLRAGLIVGALSGLAALILADTLWISSSGAPDVTQHLSLSLIFLLGLLTGFHCVGMCGAFVLGFVTADASAGRSPWLSHLSYGAGKTLSYTTIGALFGWLGAFIAFTPFLRGAAGVTAGAFLIVFGLNMLGLFAPLRRFRLGLPAPLEAWVNHEASGRHRPFVIGLLNGLMIACGPLQAMYVMAAGTGSPVEGGKMLFAFGLGTLPVMFAFGALASVLSGAVTHRLLKASGVILVALGAVMINRGLILTGAGVDLASLFSRVSPPAVERPSQPGETQSIQMEANGFGYKPDRFTLIAGKPVRWIINATEVTECNRRIVVPALRLEFDLKPGEQMVEFTPPRAGVIPWSCWMGMIRGEFIVVEAGSLQPPAGAAPGTEAQTAPPTIRPPPRDTSASPAPARVHVVARGENLRKIAKKLYGDERRWREILKANPGLDARGLAIGQKLELPRAAP